MKSIFLASALILFSSYSFAEECLFEDAVVQFADEEFQVECIKFNRIHKKWEFQYQGKTVLLSPSNSKVWTMDGEMKIGNDGIKILPSVNYYIINKNSFEPPICVDTVEIQGDTIVAHTLNAKGQMFMTIYPVTEYDVFSASGERITK